MHARPWTSAVLLALAPLAGCVAGPVAGSCPAIPELIAAPPPKPPVSYAPQVYQPPHWDWTGTSYIAVQGAWVPSGPGRRQWMEGYWAISPTGGCVWQPAHWV